MLVLLASHQFSKTDPLTLNSLSVVVLYLTSIWDNILLYYWIFHPLTRRYHQLINGYAATHISLLIGSTDSFSTPISVTTNNKSKGALSEIRNTKTTQLTVTVSINNNIDQNVKDFLGIV